MENKYIAEKLEKLGNLLEIMGENPFKVTAYYKAANTIDGMEDSVAELSAKNKLGDIPGVGDALKLKIKDIVDTGTCPKLVELEAQVPEGVMEMLHIRGLGPKKIQMIWNKMGVTSVGELLYACNENRLLLEKGFGEKTQEKIKNAIEFLQQNQDFFHYAILKPIADNFIEEVRKKFGKDCKISLTGEIRRKMPVLAGIEMIAETGLKEKIKPWLDNPGQYFVKENKGASWTLLFNQTRIPIQITFTDKNFWYALFESTGIEAHVKEVKADAAKNYSGEEEIYSSAGMQYVEPELREGLGEIELAKKNSIPKLIEYADIKGMVHNHSTWSDGIHTLEQMAIACRDLGMEYLCISDHSKSAFYANGLSEGRIEEQHKEIEALNKKLAPFYIFKGIESDILYDGKLDYSDKVLGTFDFIISSIHSQLSMPEEKATARLIKAVENPFTTILGHPTGRLLLSRQGYPIDHKKVIDACSKNNVIIEINSNPWRLDLDWTWIRYALEKEVMISVNPDAHKMEGYKDTFWGIEAGRKGMLTADRTLNCKSKEEVMKIFRAKINKS